MDEIFVIKPCITASAYEIKLKDRKIDLGKASAVLEQKIDVIAKTPAMLVVAFGESAITIYKDSIMVKNMNEEKAKDCAMQIIQYCKDSGALI